MNNALLAQMLAAGGQNEQLDNQLAQQRMQSEMLRGAASPQMHQAGRIQRAPGLLEALTGVGASAMLGRNMGQQAQTMNARTTSRQSQMAMLLKLLQDSENPQPVGPGPGGPGMMPPARPQGQGIQPPQAGMY